MAWETPLKGWSVFIVPIYTCWCLFLSSPPPPAYYLAEEKCRRASERLRVVRFNVIRFRCYYPAMEFVCFSSWQLALSPCWDPDKGNELTAHEAVLLAPSGASWRLSVAVPPSRKPDSAGDAFAVASRFLIGKNPLTFCQPGHPRKLEGQFKGAGRRQKHTENVSCPRSVCVCAGGTAGRS